MLSFSQFCYNWRKRSSSSSSSSSSSKARKFFVTKVFKKNAVIQNVQRLKLERSTT